MAHPQNNFVFKSSGNSGIKSASDIASEIFQDTWVESAYNKKGQFSHLLARLPQSEFVRLYSPQTTASVFIHGYWLQLCLRSNKKRILNRETQIELGMDVTVNNFGVTELSFFRLDKKIHRFKLKHISAFDLLNTENGYHYLARAAVKVFSKMQPLLNLQKLSMAHLPIVLVLMHQEKKCSSEFDSNLVLLQ
jgi:hypothetical protein